MATSLPTEYVEWFWPFAVEIHRVLRPDGSFVLDLGGAWNRGSGTRSLYQYELIIRLIEDVSSRSGILLVQPQQAADAGRVGDDSPHARQRRGNTLWWLSKTETPRADNRRVLQPYSPSMKRLLRDGYQTANRPSQHDIGPHFRRDNGGAIPPNLLASAEHALQRRVLPPLPRCGLADPPRALSRRRAGVLHSLPDRAGPAGRRSLRRQQRDRPRGGAAGPRWLSVETQRRLRGRLAAALRRRRSVTAPARFRSSVRCRPKRSSRYGRAGRTAVGVVAGDDAGRR